MRLFRRMLSVTLAVLMAAVITVMPAAQITAKAEADSGSVSGGDAPGKYISEVRIGLGKSKDAAAASLEGYTILKDDSGKYADLNEGAESKSIIGSKGSKVVLLGYKTTNDPADAITDLAVMNMDGGYSVSDYEALMEKYLETQIKPMLSGFVASLKEYRQNYASSVPANKKKADYAHDMLNLLYDDDTGGYLGDLLLNETKWEMGDEAYNKLSADEKKKHADLLTIFLQANGQATLSIQNLLVRASDTSDNTWIERFIVADVKDMMSTLFPTMTPTDLASMMAYMFGDDALKVLTLWDGLRSDIGKYDEAVEFIENYEMDKLQKAAATVEQNSKEGATDKELVDLAVASAQVEAMQSELQYYMSIVALHDYLERTEYFDGFSLLDFFSQPKEDAQEDMLTIYALVASLSAGQRGGLEYMTLRELILTAMTDSGEYSSENAVDAATASIYEGVDRGIYEKGGVALTSEALRKGAKIDNVEDYPLSTLTTVMCCISGASLTATLGSWVNFIIDIRKEAAIGARFNELAEAVPIDIRFEITRTPEMFPETGKTIEQLANDYGTQAANSIKEARDAMYEGGEMLTKTQFAKKLAIGITVATVIITIATLYMTYRDLCDFYDTDFSPIPNYMVDETDITRKNEKGETYVIKNQTAYYKAVLCNRAKGDEKYKEIGDKADLNGDVGRMWVALYSVKNAARYPILADSFKVVTGSSNVPLDYSNGIHKFGSGAAFDMNNTYYAWNHGKGGIYVYFKVDDTVPPRANAVTGTVQTAGTIAAVGGGGLLVGFLAGSLIMNKQGKKKDEEEAAS